MARNTPALCYILNPDGGGTLTSSKMFFTPIIGYNIAKEYYKLDVDGRLTCHDGFSWDFASGAVDTPAMVLASIPHDVFCWLTHDGEIRWRERKRSDKFFRQLLRQFGEPTWRQWTSYAGVRAFSKYRQVGL